MKPGQVIYRRVSVYGVGYDGNEHFHEQKTVVIGPDGKPLRWPAKKAKAKPAAKRRKAA
ncbi:MAG: hypothetical protein IT462_01835 [Planctomycetes bacterium]|nr:hypothetical protein [Planctomycetota bacterium]